VVRQIEHARGASEINLIGGIDGGIDKNRRRRSAIYGSTIADGEGQVSGDHRPPVLGESKVKGPTFRIGPGVVRRVTAIADCRPSFAGGQIYLIAPIAAVTHPHMEVRKMLKWIAGIGVAFTTAMFVGFLFAGSSDADPQEFFTDASTVALAKAMLEGDTE